jgi:mono/diheme cytochrome c family protein
MSVLFRRSAGVLMMLAAAGVLWLAANSAATAAPPTQAPTGDPARGAYLFTAAAGCGCHMGPAGFLAGGSEIAGPFGKVYVRNITSDPETGIGNWTADQIVAAIRTGRSANGEMLFPIMPYRNFSGMSDQDAYDLAAFIQTAPPIKNQVPARQLNFPVPPFDPLPAPATAPTEGVARGEYLVKHVSDCTGCHTPTDAQGNPDMSKFLAGAAVEGEVSANITPDNETGIGTWSVEQIAHFLGTGEEPNGEKVGGLMAQIITEGFSKMTEADRLAIGSYLKTIPAVNNVPQAAPPPVPATGGSVDYLPYYALAALGMLLLGAGIVVVRAGSRRRA